MFAGSWLSAFQAHVSSQSRRWAPLKHMASANPAPNSRPGHHDLPLPGCPVHGRLNHGRRERRSLLVHGSVGDPVNLGVLDGLLAGWLAVSGELQVSSFWSRCGTYPCHSIHPFSNPSSLSQDSDFLQAYAPLNIPHIHVKNATPLHYACLVQDMDIAKVLLEAGADWTLQDRIGRTPEELIRSVGDTCDEVKQEFARLRDAESEKRKKEEEERKKAEEEEKRKKEEEEKQKKEEEKRKKNERADSEDTDSEDDDSSKPGAGALSKVSMSKYRSPPLLVT